MNTVRESKKVDKPTLVLGGTGKTGRRVVERLTARGLPVRIGSRSGEPPFDWEERATWAPALDGVGSVYLTYYPDLAVPGAVDAVASFAEQAVQSGVPRLVLMSGRGEPEAERAEQAARESGAELTILRCTWFMQNFSEDYMLEHVLSGEIRLPAGDVPTPFLDADDIADVAVAALTVAPLWAHHAFEVDYDSSDTTDLAGERSVVSRPDRSPGRRLLALIGRSLGPCSDRRQRRPACQVSPNDRDRRFC